MERLLENEWSITKEQWSDYLRTNWAIRKSNGATTWERMEQYEWAKRMSFANEWTRERHLRMSFCEMSEQESDISEWVLRMSEQESDICEMKQKIKVGKKWATWNHYLTTKTLKWLEWRITCLLYSLAFLHALRTPMLRWSFKGFPITSYPVFITVSIVNYRRRGLNKNLGITYLTVVLMLCKILMRYV